MWGNPKPIVLNEDKQFEKQDPTDGDKQLLQTFPLLKIKNHMSISWFQLYGSSFSKRNITRLKNL